MVLKRPVTRPTSTIPPSEQTSTFGRDTQMTTIARQTTSPASRVALRTILRSVATNAPVLVDRFRRSLRDATRAAQLGPDREVEIGRSTGARI